MSAIPLPDAAAEGIGALLGAAECLRRLNHPKVAATLLGHAKTLAEALVAHVQDSDDSALEAVNETLAKFRRPA